MGTRPAPYAHILEFVLGHPWALTRPMLETIAAVLGRHMAGHTLTPEERAAVVGQRKSPPPPTFGSTAIIPVYGVIMPRANLMADLSGGTSFEALTLALRGAVSDPAIKTIVFDIDSPGGNVAGATEFAAEVLRARTVKPIIAQANYQTASGAYWLASSATQIVAAPSASVGSIGVYVIHDDLSKVLVDEGISRTYISAGKYKLDANPDEPLSDHARATLQARVDEAYTSFVNDVARGRGVPPPIVRDGYAEGGMVGAPEALALGMIDRIGTLDETLARVTRDTAQELTRATAQDLAWRRSAELALLQLDL